MNATYLEKIDKTEAFPKVRVSNKTRLQELQETKRHLEARRRYYELIQTSWYDNQVAELEAKLQQLLERRYELARRRASAVPILEEIEQSERRVQADISQELSRIRAEAARTPRPKVVKPAEPKPLKRIKISEETILKMMETTGLSRERLSEVWGFEL